MTALAMTMTLPQVAGARPVPAADTQSWQEADLSTNPSSNWGVTVSGFSRFSDMAPNPLLVGGGLSGAVSTAHWSYSAGVLYAALRGAANGSRLDVELPFAAVTGTLDLAGITLSDRFRIEDLVGVAGDPWRYRNQVGIRRHLRREHRGAYGFVTDEIFMDLNPERFTRNRLLAGFGIPVTANATTELAYVNQDDAGRRPGRIQGLSVTLKVIF